MLGRLGTRMEAWADRFWLGRVITLGVIGLMNLICTALTFGALAFVIWGLSQLGGTGTESSASDSFCSSHSCIDNYGSGTGYTVQCADGTYSHSGGRPGACSWHGGER